MNTFKFTETQIQVLKNFSSISPSIAVYPHKTEVVNASGSVCATYDFTPPLNIDTLFGVHEMNELLSVILFYKNPDIIVDGKCLSITDGSSKVKYFTTPSHLIPKVLIQQKYDLETVNNKLEEIGYDLEVMFSSEKLVTLMKMASVLKSNYMFFESCCGDTVKVTVSEKLESSSNSWEENITDGIVINKLEKPMMFNIDELKLMMVDHTVKISPKGVSKWINSFGVTYYIGCCIPN
jgi:hypothetical protein